MKYIDHTSQLARQTGAALITSLVFMAILTMLGISAMRSNTADVKIHNAMRDRANAFQCAEAALRQGERFIEDVRAKPTEQTLVVPDRALNEVWGIDTRDMNDLVKNTRTWWQANGWGDFVLNNPDSQIGCAETAEFIVQSMGGSGDDGSADLSFKKQAESQIDAYRISSRSEGVSDNSVVIVQSVFTRQFHQGMLEVLDEDVTENLKNLRSRSMKSTVLRILKLSLPGFFICVSVTAHAGKFPADKPPLPAPYNYEMVAGQSMEIESVSKRIIKVMGKEYGVGAVTKIVSKNGSSMSVKDLKKGMAVKIQYNDKQRYLNRPTLSRVEVQ